MQWFSSIECIQPSFRAKLQAAGSQQPRRSYCRFFPEKWKPEPFGSIEKVTPETLATLGVSKAKQETTVVRGSLSCMTSMCEAGEYPVALQEMLEVLRSCDLNIVASPEMADLRLLAARLYWHQGKMAKSISSVGQAVIARPIILGRPLKPSCAGSALRSLWAKS